MDESVIGKQILCESLKLPQRLNEVFPLIQKSNNQFYHQLSFHHPKNKKESLWLN